MLFVVTHVPMSAWSAPQKSHTAATWGICIGCAHTGLLCRLLGDYIGRLPVMSIGLGISAVSYLLIGPIPLLQAGPSTLPLFFRSPGSGQVSLRKSEESGVGVIEEGRSLIRSQ